MTNSENGSERGRKAGMSRPPPDDPSLRVNQSMVDKIIGSEDKDLAEKRLSAIKRAREMRSSKQEDTDDTSTSSSPLSSPSAENSNTWIQLGPTVIPKGGTYSRREPPPV